MNIRTVKAFFECFLVVCLIMGGANNASAQNIRVIVYGDSLTSGYKLQPEEAFPGKLNRKLKQAGYTNVTVENMSNPGDTTAAALERIQAVLTKRPDIVVLELGGNDALRGISPGIIYQNLGLIITQLLQIRSSVILVGMKAPSNMGYNYAQQFDNNYRTLAKAYSLPFYPFALEGVFGKPELNLADGYHPNAKGVEVMVDGVYPLVDEVLRARWDELQNQSYQQQNQEYQQQQLQLPDAATQAQ